MPQVQPRLVQLTSQVLRSTSSIGRSGESSINRHSSTMAPTVKAYDYIVIGGGSGGSGAGRRASGWYKAKTLMIENGLSGGCCVNVG